MTRCATWGYFQPTSSRLWTLNALSSASVCGWTNTPIWTQQCSDKPSSTPMSRRRFSLTDLTGAIDDDHTPPGIRGRWRATMAHEASHVVMHRVLFEVNQDQETLFHMQDQPEPQRLMRCLKKNVLFRGG